MSPYHHLRTGLPPTIIFHGTADTTVAHSTADQFCDGLRKVRTRCDLVSYGGEGHGFFNYGRAEGEEKNKNYEDTVYRMDGFLYSLEWLDPKPNPDGTPRKRETWLDSFGAALENAPGTFQDPTPQSDGEAKTEAGVEGGEKSETSSEGDPPDGP